MAPYLQSTELHAMVTSRPWQLQGIWWELRTTWKLSLVQNGTSWLLLGTRENMHTTPILQNNYWVGFKVLVLTNKMALGSYTCTTTSPAMPHLDSFAHLSEAFWRFGHANGKHQQLLVHTHSLLWLAPCGTACPRRWRMLPLVLPFHRMCKMFRRPLL